MVTSDGRVKIADFGIAKATNQMQTGAFLTATGTTVGTPTYMAPEQAMAQDIGPWTDLYSVGCMAFEMFTGRVPFHDSDAPMAILLRHVNEPIPPITLGRPVARRGRVGVGREAARQGPEGADPERRTTPGTTSRRSSSGCSARAGAAAARLSPSARQADTPKPLTPAPFEGAPEAQPSDEFQSFAWGAGGATAPPGPATPPPSPAPEGPLEPGPIDVPTGPPTPPPLEPVADSGFVTFGAPAEAPPAADAPAACAARRGRACRDAARDARRARRPRRPARERARRRRGSGFMTFGSPPAAEPPAAGDDAAPAPETARRRPRRPPPTTASRRSRRPARPRRAAEPRAAEPPASEPAAPDDRGSGRRRAAGAGRGAATPPRRAPAPDTARARRRRAAGHGRRRRRAAEKAFDTYVAPPPLRPPTEEPAPRRARSPRRSPSRARSTTRTPARRPRCRARSTAMPARPRRCRSRSAPAGPARRRSARARSTRSPSRASPASGATSPSRSRSAPRSSSPSSSGCCSAAGARRTPTPPRRRASCPSSRCSPARSRSRCPRAGRSSRRAPEIPGLALSRRRRLRARRPRRRQGGRVRHGEGDDSTLLPQKFREQLGLARWPGPRAHPGQARARRHPGLPLRGPAARGLRPHRHALRRADLRRRRDGRLLAPAEAAEGFGPECEGIADTLQISDAKTFPVGPNPAYAKTLNRTLNQLDRRVAAGRKALGRDGATFRAQARAAGNIQAAYADAARQLAGGDEPGRRHDQRGAGRQPDRAKEAWKNAASAASDKNKGGFQRSAAGDPAHAAAVRPDARHTRGRGVHARPLTPRAGETVHPSAG